MEERKVKIRCWRLFYDRSSSLSSSSLFFPLPNSSHSIHHHHLVTDCISSSSSLLSTYVVLSLLIFIFPIFFKIIFYFFRSFSALYKHTLLAIHIIIIENKHSLHCNGVWRLAALLYLSFSQIPYHHHHSFIHLTCWV